MAKRIRGLELELETGQGARRKEKRALGKAHKLEGLGKDQNEKNPMPLEKDQKPSALKLLALWAQGMLSAALAREMQDGAEHNDLATLPRTGNWGPQPGNAHLQILNQFCKDIILPEKHQVQAECLGKDNQVKGEKFFCLPSTHPLLENARTCS